MRIAQVAPLFESVPPKGYGGTERVVHWLTERLIEDGHQVTLFASGDSVSRARLVPGCPRSLRLDKGCQDPVAHHLVMLEQVSRQAHEFDIIHYHVDYCHYPFSRRGRAPQVTTLHGRLDIPDLVPLYTEYAEMPVVSISQAQRKPLPWLNWQGTVYHGLPKYLYSFHAHPGSYVAFLGRFSPEKGAERAIEIALRAGMDIKLAAKIDKPDQEYFESVIRPLLASPAVEYVGEIGQDEKQDFLGNASTLLFPIQWPEPFGLVMIEAMACGTPVLAFRGGSVDEIVTDGLTGHVCDGIDQAAECLQHVAAVDRRRCRELFELRFTDARMAEEYVDVYERILRDGKAPERAVGRGSLEPGLVPDPGDLVAGVRRDART